MVKWIFRSQGVFIFWLHGKNLLCLQQFRMCGFFSVSSTLSLVYAIFPFLRLSNLFVDGDCNIVDWAVN